LTELKPGKDFVGVGVGVMIRNDAGEMLLGLRSSNSRNEAGKWTSPGGCVEFGETLENAVIRETREEFGIEVEVVGLLKLFNHLLPDEKQHWVNPLFEAKIVKGVPKIMEPDKILELKWFPLKNLPENLTSNWQDFFKEVKAGKIKLD